ncbi:ABC transporter substrate-binding protein [Humitalea sp. 24SJ18S-53]|uniref:ABC transporter substrate-binding protein n=1 Tax=Humitalea sp. 24SJ18S-53 TaxID=3422307 RepID=UPI003D67F2FC
MRRLRIRLNTGFAGPHAGFALAEADGHLAAQGLAVDWIGGNGAAAVIEDMSDATCDAAVGDLCALIARLGRRQEALPPKAVFILFNRTPLTIAVRADGPVRHPRDLSGLRVSGHARDAAVLCFPALAWAVGIDPAQVAILPSAAPLGEQVRAMIQDDAADGVFGFVNTIIASMSGAGIGLEHATRFLEYADHLPDLYGNALVVSGRLVAAEPDVVRGLVHAVTAGTLAAIADPDRGVMAVKARNPGIDLAIETRRWRGTIAKEMAHPEAARIGLGDADPQRLAGGIAALASSLALARVPTPAEVFSAVFLPPPRDRGAG